MGLICLRAFPDAGIVALYEEPNTTGDFWDIDAPRNAPAKTPEDYFSSVYFHSQFDYMEVAQAGSVSVSHSTIAAVSAPPDTTMSIVYGWASAVDDKLVASHSLGYEPFAIVAAAGKILAPGSMVQNNTGGRARYVTPYVTTTELRLWEAASKTSSTLASTSITYDYILFKQPAGDENNILWEFDPDTGLWQMGRGRFRTDRRYLQTNPSSSLALNRGRNIDLKNGAPRFILADGTPYEPVQSGATWVLSGGSSSTPPTSLTYSGSFTNTNGIEVEAP
jgi:hypothetical protein